MIRKRYFLVSLFFLFALFSTACNGSDPVPEKDTTAVHPELPAPIDSGSMLQALPADSQHLRMPVQPLPDTGLMPVKKPDSGIVPL